MTTARATATGAIAFSDLVGFTELTAQHGDDIALALVERHEAVARKVLTDDARIVKQLGDGLLLWFPSALDAVTACASLHGALARAARDDADTGLPLWIRTGVHWGSPKLRGDDLIGHDVNVAARLVDLAQPGELLVTSTLRDAVGPAGLPPELGFRSLGPVFVKGIAEPLRVWSARVGA